MTFLTSLRRPPRESHLLQYARTLFSRRFRSVTYRTSYCMFTRTRFYHIRFTAGGPAAVCLYRKYLHRSINANARTILRQYSLVCRIVRINRCHRSMRPPNYGNPVCPTEYLSFDESQTSTEYSYILHTRIYIYIYMLSFRCTFFSMSNAILYHTWYYLRLCEIKIIISLTGK